MKIIIIILLLFISFRSVAQIRSVDIFQRPANGEVLEAVYMADSTVSIQMKGRDDASDNSSSEMTIFSGTPKEFYTFICDLEEFAEENKPDGNIRVNGKISGMPVVLEKFMGGLQIWIYGNGKSFHHLSVSWLPKYKEKFAGWAYNNNIPYN